MNIESFMRGYKAAWESQDESMFCALFSADGEYHNTPFAVQRGHDQLAEHWRRVKLQRDVHVAYEVLMSGPRSRQPPTRVRGRRRIMRLSTPSHVRTSSSRWPVSARTVPCSPAWSRVAPSRSPAPCTTCRRAWSISSRADRSCFASRRSRRLSALHPHVSLGLNLPAQRRRGITDHSQNATPDWPPPETSGRPRHARGLRGRRCDALGILMVRARRTLTRWAAAVAARRMLLLAAVAICLARESAEAAGPRIGFLSPTTPESSAAMLAGLRDGLREYGYSEATNMAIDSRFANDQFDRLPDLARELVVLPVDVLVTVVTQATIAARDMTKTIPIVMIGVSDPVASKLVAGLAHPGGNITGTSGMFSEAAGKRLQLLKEAAPGVQRVAVLWNPGNRVFQMQLIHETEAAARPLGMELQLFEARDLISIEAAFAAISKEHASGLNVLPDPTLGAHGARIAALAQEARLPSVGGGAAYADSGGLIGYGPSLRELARTAGGYVAKILKGAKPADLPVDQASKFELVINMRAAHQLGVSIPPSLRLRADRLIE